MNHGHHFDLWFKPAVEDENKYRDRLQRLERDLGW